MKCKGHSWEHGYYLCKSLKIIFVKTIKFTNFRQLNKRGLKDHQIKEILEHGYKAWLNQESLKLPYLDQATWLLPNVSRTVAESLLLGMPTGTFLIRYAYYFVHKYIIY